jgi:hypothetical protein
LASAAASDRLARGAYRKATRGTDEAGSLRRREGAAERRGAGASPGVQLVLDQEEEALGDALDEVVAPELDR